eukprot:NODE_763_length_706_cov_49.216134_g694_i0.p2 GENE.NODE_763_length_706_cov_49.216134_g694_i0~~NODE_763_length_706_cov_49.216134_g694_i0.p2  ORF type:complete len:71 (-),score=20.89 NODE_763_length_706_cov_49.216134_g694_i0:270-482(-)
MSVCVHRKMRERGGEERGRKTEKRERDEEEEREREREMRREWGEEERDGLCPPQVSPIIVTIGFSIKKTG